MKRNISIVVLGLLVSCMTAFAQPGTARREMGMRGDGMFPPALKLTDQQKSDVRKVWFDLRQKQIDVRAKLEHARLDYEQLASSNSPDHKALSAEIQQMSDLRAQLQQNKLDAWFAVNKLLTPDQQKVWQKVLQHPRMFERRARVLIREKVGNMMGRMGTMRRGWMMDDNGPRGGGMGPMMQQAPPSPDSGR